MRRRNERSSQAILRAALEVCLERGYDKASIEAIAKRAAESASSERKSRARSGPTPTSESSSSRCTARSRPGLRGTAPVLTLGKGHQLSQRIAGPERRSGFLMISL
jgi:hypothetical protein